MNACFVQFLHILKQLLWILKVGLLFTLFYLLHQGQHIEGVYALIVYGVHILTYNVDAQTAKVPFFCWKCGVYFRLNGGIERLAAVNDSELQSLIVMSRLYLHVTVLSLWIGVSHHVDHRLLYSN